MRMNALKAVGIWLAVLCLFSNVFAITWFPKEFTCPIDQEKNTFMVIGSYGSYIYSYPSKYQWLFFPDTANNNFYMCKKCHLTTYMWDFDDFPADKVKAVRSMLAEVKFEKKFDNYNTVPVSERLEVMEKVYGELDKDELWWERFNRIKGYHYGKEGKAEKAREARLRSLETITTELKKKESEIPKKLLYYISGSMKHFLSDDTGAKADFNTALETKYFSKGDDDEENKNAETGMNERLNDYLKIIESKDSPRSADTEPGHDH